MTSSVMGRTSKGHQRTIDGLSARICMLLVWGKLHFMSSVSETHGNILVIHGPSLRKHLGGRVTSKQVETALNKLRAYGVIRSIQHSMNTYVLVMNPLPGFGFFPPTQLRRGDVGPAELLTITTVPERKLRPIEEMARNRMVKKAILEEGAHV